MPSRQHPHIFRVWKVLHYLNEFKDKVDDCRKSPIMSVLRTNNTEITKLLDDLLEKELIEVREDSEGCYAITDKGYNHLIMLRNVLPTWFEKDIQEFCTRTKRY